MPIEKIFAHLVYPNYRGELENPFTASEVALTGKLFGMLKEVYDGSPAECTIDIQFRSSKQDNVVRSLIIETLLQRNSEAAATIARRLAGVTTRRSQLGLFFVIIGKEEGKECILLSRFPTDNAILADDTSGGLSVEFLEKVFVKKWSSYKGAYFRDSIGGSGFWSGKVVDRQINAPTGEASKYWVENFLDSEFVTTSQLGTKRFASALSDASRSASGEERQELNSLVPFLKQFNNKSVSVSEMIEKIGLSEGAKEKLEKHMPRGTLGQVFEFDFSSLRNMVTFRTMLLETGVSVTADSAEFQKLVDVNTVQQDGSEVVTLSATGKLIGDQLRKQR